MFNAKHGHFHSHEPQDNGNLRVVLFELLVFKNMNTSGVRFCKVGTELAIFSEKNFGKYAASFKVLFRNKGNNNMATVRAIMVF